ncbi:MAG TPA: hypothetical protein VM938_06055 [Acidimicrobiales bacterium]|nr:hypothetical protein [Acidimicrobiales bacterium]
MAEHKELSMPEIDEIPVANLLLDPRNARLGDEQPSQQAIYIALAKQQGKRLVKLAEDIVNNGLDPTTLPAVVPTPDRLKRYRVIEGNRRILAVKALETPSIVTPALGPAERKRLIELSGKYADSPIDAVNCVLFDNEADAEHWIRLRHTGANEGVGLVEWDPNEQDRYLARTGARQPTGQVVDFVNKLRGTKSGTGIITNLKRLLGTPEVREALGIELVNNSKTVVSHYPAEEVVKGLSRVVDDLEEGRVKVKNLYEKPDRVEYIKTLTRKDLPTKSKRLKMPVTLDDLASGHKTPAVVRPKKSTKRPKATTRSSVIPKESKVNPNPPRINAIYNELAQLNVDQCPNACAVLLRVFVELSVDHEIEKAKLMTEAQRRNAPLAKRMKELAAHLEQTKRINAQLRKAIEKIANTQDVIAASTTTFNQYVHNPYVHPKPGELRTAWDELEPFMEKLWP